MRWSFTQLHTSLLRKRPEPVLQLVAAELLLDGRRLPREDFLAAYVVPAQPGELRVALCAACPGHWTVEMQGRSWCWSSRGRGWELHRVGGAPCDGK